MASARFGATRAAENGATVAEMNAIFGWSGEAMPSLYTRSADRARLAKKAITKPRGPWKAGRDGWELSCPSDAVRGFQP
jgi:hypothetical protein